MSKIFAKIKNNEVVNTFIADDAFVDHLKNHPILSREFDEIMDVTGMDPYPTPGYKKNDTDFDTPWGDKLSNLQKINRILKEALKNKKPGEGATELEMQAAAAALGEVLN